MNTLLTPTSSLNISHIYKGHPLFKIMLYGDWVHVKALLIKLSKGGNKVDNEMGYYIEFSKTHTHSELKELLSVRKLSEEADVS